MRLVFALLLSGVVAIADPLSQPDQSKPAIIQDGQAAQDYITKALYEYLDKPPYLVIHTETPFFEKRVAGKDMWIALVEFNCGSDEQDSLHCITVIVYDPTTNDHRFMKPEEIVQSTAGEAI